MHKDEPIPVYCFSGLGADFRIFNKLKIAGVQMLPIQWSMPEKNDTMRSFAQRLATQIVHDNPVLLGVSFGGMLVTELVDIVQPQKAFVISSCTRRQQLAPWLRAVGRIGLHKLIPYHRLLQFDGLNRFVFDPASREEELYLKRLMLKENDIEFLRRSVHIIMHWQRRTSPDGIIHIHGTADKMLPLHPRKVHYAIRNAGHFMVWNRAEELSPIIRRHLFDSGS